MSSTHAEITSASREEADFILDQLSAFNLRQAPPTQDPVFVLKNYVIKEEGKVIAGIKACVYNWGILSVEALFIDEAHRHKGLGSMLLQKVEEEAKAMGATLARLDTYDFQAPEFYLKHGYEVFGILEDCPQNHKRFYLKKKL